MNRAPCVCRIIMPDIRIPLFQYVQTLDRRRCRFRPALPADTPSAKPAWMIFMWGPQDSSIHSVAFRRMNTGFDHTRLMPQNACAPVTCCSSRHWCEAPKSKRTRRRGDRAKLGHALSPTRRQEPIALPQNGRTARYSESAVPPTVTYGSGSLTRFSGDAGGCRTRLSAQMVNTLFFRLHIVLREQDANASMNPPWEDGHVCRRAVYVVLERAATGSRRTDSNREGPSRP